MAGEVKLITPKESRSMQAVERARERRVGQAQKESIRTIWFIDQAVQHVKMSVHARMNLAMHYLLSKTVVNISVPVLKAASGTTVQTTTASGKVRSKKMVAVKVIQRSKPGEFPRADTTTLMKTLFVDVQQNGNMIDGYLGTPLDYGVILELSMNRRFMTRTFQDERHNLAKILIEYQELIR